MTEPLERIVATAVATSLQAATRQLADLDELGATWSERLRQLETAGLVVASETADETPLSSVVAALVDHCLEALRARLTSLTHLHIVLFGRTGAGKSSFVEAMTRGTGERISPDGRLDYTREAAAAIWAGMMLLDTPGTEGWAEREDRDVIELEAHEAVQRADVVVLVFDDYNQKLGEFAQVARWVTGLGKAAVAVLNVRDDAWRYDSRLWHPDDRESSVQQVREHARHVERMLAEVGLAGVPLVALNLAWAFGARGSSLARHPAAMDLELALNDLGAKRLAEVSNFPVIEELLTQLVSEDPEGLRLGALKREQEVALEALAARLGAAQDAAALRASQLERAIDAVLAKTGLPDTAEVARLDLRERHDLGKFIDRLAAGHAERPRARPGQVAKLLDQHLEGPLLQCRSAGLKAAQNRLGASSRRSISAEALQSAALAAAEFDATTANAVSGAYENLAQELKEEAEDLQAEFAFEVEDFLHGFDAGAGQAKRVIGGVGGFVVAAAAGVLFAAGGWAIGAGLGVGVVGGWLARKIRRSGNDDRIKARLRAEREVAIWLEGTADAARSSALELLQTAAWMLAAQTQGRGADLTAAYRRLEQGVRGVRLEIYRTAATLGKAPLPSSLLNAAKQAVEHRRFPNDLDAAAKVWLGEDWLDRPEGPVTARGPGLIRPSRGDDIALPSPSPSAALEFWSHAEEAATVHPRLGRPVAEGRAVLGAPPIIAFVGDYSSGKSSLIHRLATMFGVDVEPGRLVVGAAPTTGELTAVNCPDLVLLDTPGLGSDHPDHDIAAADAAAGAAVIVVLHTPVEGILGPVLRLLRPRGTGQARAHRALHVLGRIDALSARPHTDPDGFLRLLEVKRNELRERLLGAGLPDHSDLPLPVAADPGRRHASAAAWPRSDFLPFEGWDGVNDLAAAIRRLAGSGVAGAAIDRAANGILDARSDAASELTTATQRQREHERLRQLLDRAIAQHERVEKRVEADLHSVVEDAVARRLEELSDMSTKQLEKVRAAPEGWLMTDDLAVGFEAWRERALVAITQVYTELGAAIDARVSSRAFGAAFKADGNDPLADAILKGVKDVLGAAAGAGGDAAGGIAQDIASRLPMLAAVAERLGTAVAKGVTAAAGVVLEAVAQGVEARAQKKRERRLEDAKDAIRDAAAEWVAATIKGTDAEPGVLAAVLTLKRERLEEPLAQVQQRVVSERDHIADLGRTCEIADVLIEEADHVLA